MSKRRNLITIIKQIQSGNIFLGDKIESVDIEIVRNPHKPKFFPAPEKKSTWIDKIMKTSPELEIIEPIPEPEIIIFDEQITTFSLEQYRGSHERAIEHQMHSRQCLL
jgi:hypothetical protein